MTSLTPATRRRLQQIRQVPSVWEGDRRPLVPGFASAMDADPDAQGECILWVDGVEETVRAMDVVPADAGPEVMVRSLLRAIESPHGGNVKPARPQRIIVGDRETQFYLRGVLQDLDIIVDYSAELPLIDEIFRGMQEIAENQIPALPPDQEEALLKAANDLWEDAPWDLLDEEKILAVELNYGDVETLYVSILGMLGMEYGILMYRSLDSLKQFRQRVLAAGEETEGLERAFLDQDCFFVTFNDADFIENGNGSLTPTAEPTFGSLHPLEGMRPMLYEEEAMVVRVALIALHRFFEQNLPDLDVDNFPERVGRYRIPNPKDAKQKVTVQVKTLPEVAAELSQMGADQQEDASPGNPLPVLRDDLIPDDSFYSLGAMPISVLEMLRTTAKVYQKSETALPDKVDEFPMILIQTTRPKAMELIDGLQAAGGLEAICFNSGEDPFLGEKYDLGILKTGNGELHLFGEFHDADPVHIQAKQKWNKRCKKTKGICGLVIAKGLTGSTRGNPDLKDMLALFEVKSLSEKDLGLGPLELVPQFDF
ncbi:MAG TPA: hypothetical protein IGS37_10400 [Synechococcales cyanobacterium M55_K2018_004]|nr:hypothetical protein [Synechococcales cyanobacterium M55_K2018_004]